MRPKYVKPVQTLSESYRTSVKVAWLEIREITKVNIRNQKALPHQSNDDIIADILRRLQVYKYQVTMRTIIVDEANQAA